MDDSNDLLGGRFTQYTLLIYLSSCGGGETVFYGEPLAGQPERDGAGWTPGNCSPQPSDDLATTPGSASPHLHCLRYGAYAGNRNRKLLSVAPAPGLALLHKHGDCCLEHEAAAVTAGCKYVLRSDVVFQEHRTAGR